MKKILSTLAVALAAGAVMAGCGTVQAGQARQAGATVPRTGQPVIDAALVTHTFGWVLTPDQLLVTRDGGGSFTELRVPVAPGWSRAAAFRDQRNGIVVGAAGNVVTVARTTDGGLTWRTSRVRNKAETIPADFGRLRVAVGDQAHGMIMAQWITSSAFSDSTIFSTSNGGTTWSARRGPSAGEIAVEPGGRSWLANGDRLFRSDDAGRHWTKPRLQVAGTADWTAVSPPVNGVLPVTVVRSGQTQVALLYSADSGLSWREASRVTVRGKTGPGVTVPLAATAAGSLVIDTAGGNVYRGAVVGRLETAGGLRSAEQKVADLRPSGLPEGVHAVRFATGSAGWALSVRGQCSSGKTGCARVHTVLSTADGGLTWRELMRWEEPLV